MSKHKSPSVFDTYEDETGRSAEELKRRQILKMANLNKLLRANLKSKNQLSSDLEKPVLSSDEKKRVQRDLKLLKSAKPITNPGQNISNWANVDIPYTMKRI